LDYHRDETRKLLRRSVGPDFLAHEGMLTRPGAKIKEYFGKPLLLLL